MPAANKRYLILRRDVIDAVAQGRLRSEVRLLNRIKWDADFGKETFALGYYDRVA